MEISKGISHIEVFKTNVQDPVQASVLLEHIHNCFDGYVASFDLEDCDRILRVQSHKGKVDAETLVLFLKEFLCTAEVLPD